MHAPNQYFQNPTAYFVTAKSYDRKMFMKLSPGEQGKRRWQTPGANLIKLFTAVIYRFS
jgi:hypothetical protein